MRVTHQTIYQNITHNVDNITEQLKNINEQISSSRRINRPSDDPVGITQALNVKEVLAQIQQYGTNIKHTQSWLQMTESSLQQVEDLTIRAKTIAGQMSTGTYNASDRTNAAREVQNLIEQLVQIGNTKISGRYIFSGGKDQTRPYGSDLYIHSAVADTDNNTAYTGTASSSGTYTGLYSKNYVVQITTPGAVGAAKYKVSEDGGTTWGDAFTTSATGSGVYAGATTSVTNPGWTGTSEPSSSGNDFTGTSSAQYTFRVPTVILDGLNALATVTWTKTGGGIGSFDIPVNYGGTALVVEDGLTVSFETGAGEALVDGNTFTVDVTPSTSLESPPNQGAKIAFTDGPLTGTLTVGDRFSIEVSQYNGNQDRVSVNIAQSAQINRNLHGDEVFGEAGDTNNNLFDTLAGLEKALEDNNIAGVQATLDRLTNVQVRNSSNLADIGSRLNRLEVCQNLIADLETNNTQRLSAIEDIDITKAVTDLNAKQVVLQAALYSSVQLTKASLMDYLK